MTRIPILVFLATLTTLGIQTSSGSAETLTFHRDVLPILESHCQTCHRQGGIAPVPLMSYAEVRPWAKAIKAKVVSRQMPPWFALPGSAKLRNAPQLTDSDIQTLVAWADSGAHPGDPADERPQTRQWVEGWRTRPDVVVSMDQAYPVPAKGDGEIKEFFVPSPFKEDSWVTSIEVRPGDPSVVHHVIVQTRDSMSRVPLNGSAYSGQFLSGPGTFMTMEAVYAPGSQPLDFGYTNSAKLIPGGKPIRLEVHYTPNGKATTDKTQVGFTLARSEAKRRFVIMAPEHLGDTRKPIPARAANWKTQGQLKFKQDVDLAWFMPHMHLRGKDMTFELIHPNGKRETVLSATFDFHWQLGYELETPIRAPKGSRLVVTAHHDNSPNNRNNPDATQKVDWGELTSQEMMLPWFGVIVDGDSQPDAIASYKQKGFDPPIFLPDSGVLILN